MKLVKKSKANFLGAILADSQNWNKKKNNKTSE